MLSVFALLMSAVTLLCNKMYFTYMGSFMAPSPYLLALWLETLVLALTIVDTDLILRQILFCVTCLMLRSCNLHVIYIPEKENVNYC